jgi:cytochrome c oxidase assembly protein subunit 15
MHSSNTKIILWLYSGCLLTFAMVVIGGITRLTGSGLSITEWKVITGTIPPLNEQQWLDEFGKYQLSPQFQKINSSFGLDDFKHIYWWEYLHRLIGRMIGLVFIVPFIYFYTRKQISKQLLPKLIVIFLLGAWQGFLGWYMVSSGLVDNPFVSHIRLAIHLVNAFITFGYIFWVAQDLRFEGRPRSAASKKVLWLTAATLVLLTVQITYGAFVAGLHAGHVFNTWPKMGDEWIASSVSMSFSTEGFRAIYNGIAVVQFIHRTVALTVLLLVIYTWLNRNSLSWNLDAGQRSAITLSLVFLSLQVLLGIFTLLLSVPVWLGVLHQAGAFIIFACMVFQLHRISR